MAKSKNKHSLSALIIRMAFIVACTCPATMNAQMTAQDTLVSKRGTRIYIREEHSDRMKIIAQAFFLNLDCGTGDALRVGAGAEADYFLPKMASAHIAYTHSYFDIQRTNVNTLNKGTNAISNYSLFEIGGRFHLLDRKALKRCKTQLSHHGSRGDHFMASQGGGSIPENYLIARLPARRILALRGGLYHTTSIASTDMNKSELAVGGYGAVKTKDGSVFSNAYFTNAHTTGIYVGLSEIFNMWIKIKPQIDEFEGHTYLNGIFREIYADVIIAPTSFDPFISGSKSYEIDPNTKGSFQTSPIGLRVGKRIVYTRKTLNLGFNFELGDKPGVVGLGYYFGCGMSIAFVK